MQRRGGGAFVGARSGGCWLGPWGADGEPRHLMTPVLGGLCSCAPELEERVQKQSASPWKRLCFGFQSWTGDRCEFCHHRCSFFSTPRLRSRKTHRGYTPFSQCSVVYQKLSILVFVSVDKRIKTRNRNGSLRKIFQVPEQPDFSNKDIL